MKAPFLFVLGLAVLSTTSSSAQTEKGRWLIGGTIGFNGTSSQGGDSKTTEFSMMPNAGYFIIDNLAIGASLDLTAGKQKFDSPLGDFDQSYSQIGLSPFARYYFYSANPIAVFGQGRFGFGSSKVEDEDGVSFFSYGLGIGLDYFLNDNIAIEGILGFDGVSVEDVDDPINNFGLNIGIQAFIGGPK